MCLNDCMCLFVLKFNRGFDLMTVFSCVEVVACVVWSFGFEIFICVCIWDWFMWLVIVVIEVLFL